MRRVVGLYVEKVLSPFLAVGQPALVQLCDVVELGLITDQGPFKLGDGPAGQLLGDLLFALNAERFPEHGRIGFVGPELLRHMIPGLVHFLVVLNRHQHLVFEAAGPAVPEKAVRVKSQVDQGHGIAGPLQAKHAFAESCVVREGMRYLMAAGAG